MKTRRANTLLRIVCNNKDTIARNTLGRPAVVMGTGHVIAKRFAVASDCDLVASTMKGFFASKPAKGIIVIA
ncbi:hypothetical protein WBP06_18990 [Novosphingobium sp. BL-8H]|uniref:hypothetical protein n=1 Tax=Novosphingobium sp. BL-8H TaxID=3127640 RepID=UPI0037566C67